MKVRPGDGLDGGLDFGECNGESGVTMGEESGVRRRSKLEAVRSLCELVQRTRAKQEKQGAWDEPL